MVLLGKVGEGAPGRGGLALPKVVADGEPGDLLGRELDAGGGRVAAGPRVGRGGGGGIGCHHAHLPRPNFSDPRFVGVGSSRAIAAFACAVGSSTGWTPAHWSSRKPSFLPHVTPRQREPSAHLASPG